jgi:hypothetical protein
MAPTDISPSSSPSKRYYYTDPLAAAWMTKHFGVKLQVRHSYKDEDYGFLDVTSCSPMMRIGAI